MEETKVENEIKKMKESGEESFGNEKKEVENENEKDSLREIVPRDYLSEEIKDLYALDYVSGSQSVWDVLENKQKADRKRETVKYKKYADKFEEDVFGERGLMSFLESKNMDLNNKKEIEKELLEYLHTNNLKKVLNLMVEKILEREKESLNEEEMENIRGAFSYYKYHPGDKRAKERFLEKFLNRGKMNTRKEQEENRKEAVLDTEKDKGEKGEVEHSEKSGDLKEKSQKDLSEEPKNTEIKSENGKESFSKEDFEKKYILGKIYTNPDGKEIKIKDYDPEEEKVRVEIFPDLFNDLGEDEDENGNKTKEWEFNKSVSEAKEEKIMERKEFEEWFQEKRFYLEEEVASGKESGEDNVGAGDKKTKDRELTVEEDANDSLGGTQSEENEQQGEKPEGGQGESAGEKTDEEKLKGRIEKIKGFYVHKDGRIVILKPMGESEFEVITPDKNGKMTLEGAENFLADYGNEFKKYESEQEVVGYLKNNILATGPDVGKKVGLGKDKFEVKRYYFDKNEFKAEIEEKGQTNEVTIEDLRNKISELEKAHIEIMEKELGKPGEKIYQKKKNGRKFLVKDYKLDRETGNRRVVLQSKDDQRSFPVYFKGFEDKYEEVRDENKSQEQVGSKPEDQLKEVGVDAEEYLKNYAESDQDYINKEMEKNKKGKPEDSLEEGSMDADKFDKEKKLFEKISKYQDEREFIEEDLLNFVKDYREELEEYLEKNEGNFKEKSVEEAMRDYIVNFWEEVLPRVIDKAKGILVYAKKDDVIEYLKIKAEESQK